MTPSQFLLPRNCQKDLFDSPPATTEQIYRQQNKLSDEFWKMLLKEYLGTLRERGRKWHQSFEPLNVANADFGGKHAERSMGFGKGYHGNPGRRQ